jgi:DNA-binding FrmR family transcriptional regulator
MADGTAVTRAGMLAGETDVHEGPPVTATAQEDRVELDASALSDVTKRLRRVQGQVGGIIQMIEDGRDCTDVLTQIAAASRALDRAGFKLVATGLRQCLADRDGAAGTAPSEQELERLFMSLA